MEEKFYHAWISGDVGTLKILYAADSISTEFQKLNQSRNEEIATKIMSVVNNKEKGVFIFGAVHLLDPHRNTVLQLFENQLPIGWNIQ